MIVLLYLDRTNSSKITGYEVLQKAPTPLPANSATINLSSVPDTFFEGPDAYTYANNQLTLPPNGSVSNRILTLDWLDAATRRKVDKIPWARYKLVKTKIFLNL